MLTFLSTESDFQFNLTSSEAENLIRAHRTERGTVIIERNGLKVTVPGGIIVAVEGGQELLRKAYYWGTR